MESRDAKCRLDVNVFKRGGVFHYEFEYHKQRYRRSTGQLRREDAEIFQNRLKLQLRQELAGLAPSHPKVTPRFQDWAETYSAHVKGQVGRPERIADLLRVVLGVLGEKPPRTVKSASSKASRITTSPGDVGVDPFWIIGKPRNQYRSTLSQMYQLAIAPE